MQNVPYFFLVSILIVVGIKHRRASSFCVFIHVVNDICMLFKVLQVKRLLYPWINIQQKIIAVII